LNYALELRMCTRHLVMHGPTSGPTLLPRRSGFKYDTKARRIYPSVAPGGGRSAALMLVLGAGVACTRPAAVQRLPAAYQIAKIDSEQCPRYAPLREPSRVLRTAAPCRRRGFFRMVLSTKHLQLKGEECRPLVHAHREHSCTPYPVDP
jgi:hypothetical protein